MALSWRRLIGTWRNRRSPKQGPEGAGTGAGAGAGAGARLFAY